MNTAALTVIKNERKKHHVYYFDGSGFQTSLYFISQSNFSSDIEIEKGFLFALFNHDPIILS